MKQLVFRLSLIALACGTALSLMQLLTAEQISFNKANFATQQLRSVLKANTKDQQSQKNWVLKAIAEDVYQINQQQNIVGHIFKISTNKGYNGKIELWLAISVTGIVLGTRVISHNETPGLADNIKLAASDWILSFNHHSLTSTTWTVKKDGGDFDQFSGATITPRAIVAAIKQGLNTYKTKRPDWIDNADS